MRWEAQRHTAFLAQLLGTVANRLALNAPGLTAVESGVVASLAGAVQNRDWWWRIFPGMH